jgi:hypothetical protein
MATATTHAMTMTMTMNSSSTPFDSVCVDTIGNILSFCDFRSAVIFARATSQSLRARFDDDTSHPHHQHRHDKDNDNDNDKDNLEHAVWKAMFQRQRFCPLLLQRSHDDDHLNQCLYRRHLLQNLLQPTKKTRKNKSNNNNNNCFNLPHSYFHFVPIVPRNNYDHDDNGRMDLDPPTIMWECDSFCLTSTATGCELILLHPFDGSLVVYPNVLRVQGTTLEEHNSNLNANANANANAKNAQQVDQELMQICLLDNKDKEKEESKLDEHVLDNILLPLGPSSSSPQYLLDAADFDSLNVDLAQYFPNYQQPHRATEEFERIPVGVDSKPLLDLHGNIVGNMVLCGQSIHNDVVHPGRSEPESLVCTEIVTWFQYAHETEYGHKHTCRFPFSFQCIDVDGVYRRLFVSFEHAGEQHQHGPVDPRRGPRSTRGNRCQIAIYSMIPVKNNNNDNPQNYFPDPLCFIHCQHPVSSFSVDPTGTTLLVSTIGGTVEIWNILQRTNNKHEAVVPVRTGVLRVKTNLQTSIRRALMAAAQEQEQPREGPSLSSSQASHLGRATTELPSDADARRTGNDPESSSFANHTRPQDPVSLIAASVLSRQPDLERYRVPIESFLLPRHLALDDCGFVTSQHSGEEGTSLLLWNKNKNELDKQEQPYQIVSLINLPLSPRRRPRFWYDGIRLIVFGQDHIGFIILIYRVLNSMDMVDAHLFSTYPCGGESSGGVYNLTNNPPRFRLANRVRHVGLGGMSSMDDTIHMTCNERLLVVNTKTGHLLPDESCSADGLLVIDLQDHGVE